MLDKLRQSKKINMKKVSLTRIGIGLSLASFTALTLAPVALAEPYGWSPQVDFSNQGAPQCGNAKPNKAPVLLQPNHPVLPKKPKKGEVVLYWHKVPGASGYNIYYGLSPKNYIYTAPNLGDTNNFTVTHLAGKTYYFAVQAKNGCAAGALSNEWAGRAGGGGTALAAATGFTPVKQSTGATPKQSPSSSSNTIVLPTVEPTKATAVQGITAPPAKVNQQQPTVRPQSQTGTRPPTTATPTTKPQQTSWWDWVLKALGLSR